MHFVLKGQLWDFLIVICSDLTLTQRSHSCNGLTAFITMVFLLFFFCLSRCWLKKLKMISFVPSPDEFFKPLHQKHQGNFKVRDTISRCVVSKVAPQVAL